MLYLLMNLVIIFYYFYHSLMILLYNDITVLYKLSSDCDLKKNNTCFILSPLPLRSISFRQSVYHRDDEPSVVFGDRPPAASQLPLGSLREPHRAGPQLSRSSPSTPPGDRRSKFRRCQRRTGKGRGMAAKGLAAHQQVSRDAQLLRYHHRLVLTTFYRFTFSYDNILIMVF